MSNLSKRTKKGFTLIELVIVMAIFGLLMIAVISIANPVSKIFKKADFAEKSYSDTNNIQLYLQNQLQYADNLVIYTEDNVKSVGDSLAVANKFAVDYYQEIVTKDLGNPSLDVNATKNVDGKVYVLRLVNHDPVYGEGEDPEVDSENNPLKRGQIYLYEYPFKSDETMTVKKAGVPQLSDAYFTNSKYVYNYAIGAQKLKNVENLVEGSREKFSAFADEVDNIALLPRPNYQNLSVSVVASRSLSSKEKDIFGDDEKNPYQDYSVFKGPVSLSVANIPLLNLSFRNVSDAYEDSNGSSRRVSMVKRYVKDTEPDYWLEYEIDEANPWELNPDGTRKIYYDGVVNDNGIIYYPEGEYVPNYKKDLSGNLIPKKDEDGNVIYKKDGAGNMIPIYKRDAFGKVEMQLVRDKYGNVEKDELGNDKYEPVVQTHYTLKRQESNKEAFNAYEVYDVVDASQDIYFVYSYADELK